jgi:hypothetical protein
VSSIVSQPLFAGQRLKRDEFLRRWEAIPQRSTVFPGLWLDPSAMLALDGPRVTEALDRGMQSPEHAAFVESVTRQK